MNSCAAFLLVFLVLLQTPQAALANTDKWLPKHIRSSVLSQTVGRLHKRNHGAPQMKLISGFTFQRSSQTPSFKFQPPLDEPTAINTLRNRKLVFIGDSITRYQYLNMVYFLERGHFPQPFCTDEKLAHSVCCQRSVGASSKDANWNAFFQLTNDGLNGHEICDCARNKQFNLENRVYRNEELNTVVAFFWLGRDLGINLRENMFTYPLQPACSIPSYGDIDSSQNASRSSIGSCSNADYVASQFDNVTLIGDAIKNITLSLKPDMVVLNWGHHTMYKWQKGFGRLQYESITRAVMQLRAEHFNTFLFWKTTTPLYLCDKKKQAPSDGNESERRSNSGRESKCRLKVMTESDGQNPVKLGHKLVQEGVLESFDAQRYVQLLYAELQRRRVSRGKHRHPLKDNNKIVSDATTPCAIASMNTTRDGVVSSPDHKHECRHQLDNPLGWDSLHYYCWVNTELNRALISSFLQKLKS